MKTMAAVRHVVQGHPMTKVIDFGANRKLNATSISH